MSIPIQETLSSTPEGELTVLKLQGETSFHAGERFRLIHGMGVLNDLLRLRKEEVNALLGIREIPFGFSFSRDWLEPTGVYLFKATIGDKDGKPKIEMIGVRVQNNVVDRDGQARNQGLIVPTGGGTRVTFVPAILEDRVWQI